jgi:hypothetical protein
MHKNIIFFITCPQAHHLYSKNLIFWLKFCAKFFRHCFSPLNKKRHGSGSVPLTIGSGSESRRPKNMRILRIRIPNTAKQATASHFSTTVKRSPLWSACLRMMGKRPHFRPIPPKSSRNPNVRRTKENKRSNKLQKSY